jgi:hypothetical protein
MDNRYAEFYALAGAWYKRCNISPGETVLIAADSGTDERATNAFFSVASSMGAEAVVAMCQRRGQPFSDVPKVVEEAMLEADFIHQLTTWAWSYSESRARVIRKIRATGEGRMTWNGGRLEHLRTPPDERVIERTKQVTDLLNQATEVRITSALGTDLSFKRGDPKHYPVLRHGGDCDRPGRIGSLAGGIAYMGEEGSANGVLYVNGAQEAYDGLGSVAQMLEDVVKLEIENGYIVNIDTSNRDGKRLDAWLKSFDDPEMYMFIHTNIGLDHRAALRARPGGVTYSHSAWGCIITAFGMNYNPLFGMSHKAPAHLDLMTTGVNYFIDGTQVLRDGVPTEEAGLA